MQQLNQPLPPVTADDGPYDGPYDGPDAAPDAAAPPATATPSAAAAPAAPALRGPHTGYFESPPDWFLEPAPLRNDTNLGPDLTGGVSLEDGGVETIMTV